MFVFCVVTLATTLVIVICALEVPGPARRPFVPPSEQVAITEIHQHRRPAGLWPHLPVRMVPQDLQVGDTLVTTSTDPGVLPGDVGSSMSAPAASAGIQPRDARNDMTPESVFSPLPSSVVSPINVDRLEALLSAHPDRELVSFVISGFRHGFDIGFVGPPVSTRPRNLLSARSHPTPVTEAILKEVRRGHTAGPFLSPPLLPFHCSPLGAVPKKDGTFRLILDLSSPRGQSINEGISKDQYSVRYSKFDDAIALVRSFGSSAFMAKLDIKHAFRLCPVRPDQWALLGYCWQDQFFLDTRLPFGSRSSPFIFNAFADLLLWLLIFICGISHAVHYLDDFFLCSSSPEECQAHMDVMCSLFSELGIPLAQEKTVGPVQCVSYLGIEIDAHSQVVRLPVDKFNDLMSMLAFWQGRKKCTKRELLSLIGSLSFAAKVVKPGRMFLRRLIDLSTSVSSLNHHITLNSEGRADIAWWLEFLPSWNGVCFIQSEPVTSVSLSLYTDASGVGFGAVFGQKWFSHPWPEDYSSFHINIKELFAIVAAVLTWGHEWHDQQILFFTDNSAITHVWRTGTSVDRVIMKLVRFMFLFVAKRNVNVLMHHIPGHSNNAADALSRLQVQRFRLHSSVCSVASFAGTGMSLEHLDLAVFRFQQAALAPSTYSTYSSGVRSYRLFCIHTGSPVLPLTELTLQRYAASMANRVGYKTIKVYLSGVQYLSIMSGFDVQVSSFMRLYYTLRGIRRIQGSRFGRQRRLPISITQLMFLHHRVQLQRYSPFEALMLRTSASLAFFGLLRCSEFTTATRSSFDASCDLLVQDILFSGEFSIMKVHIKASKTDPFREGCTIRIAAVGSAVCPVALMRRYLRCHPTGTGPLFVWRPQFYLVRTDVVSLLRRCFPGVTNINTHSFRIGGASAAASVGVPDSQIQILGRWSSDAYRRYLHLSDTSIRDMCVSLLHSPNSRVWDAGMGVSVSSGNQ